MEDDKNDVIILHNPHDFHCHIRDGLEMKCVLPYVCREFVRAIIMPNLKPPCVTTQHAMEYRERLMKCLDVEDRASFEPLMTLYLTDGTSVEEIHTAVDSGIVFGVKLYPAGATTNSDNGVTDITKVYPVLEAMALRGLPLLVHGEVTDSDVDLFNREAVFIDRVLQPLVARFPTLKIVMEHITTAKAVEFVRSASDNVSATITAHHLLYNRNRLFQRGINPHYYCLPILKTSTDQDALIEAATSGHHKFFAGTDSAPHAQDRKESCCGAAGCYTSFGALELYAEVFDKHNALDKLEAFVCQNGAKFYGLDWRKEPVKTVTLKRQPWTVPDSYPFGPDSVVVPLRAGEQIMYSIVDS